MPKPTLFDNMRRNRANRIVREQMALMDQQDQQEEENPLGRSIVELLQQGRAVFVTGGDDCQCPNCVAKRETAARLAGNPSGMVQ